MSTQFCCISTDVTYYTQTSRDIVLETKCSEGTEQFFINEWCDAEKEVTFTCILLQYTKEDDIIFI
jgi:hypothetical protein